MKRIIDVMCRCHLFDGIPEDKYKNVLNCLNAQLKTYAKDAVILHIGEQQGRPGMVVSGTLRLALYSEDGNLLTIDRLSVGQIFGETLACAKKQESPVQIDALSDAEVLYLSFDPLLLEQGASCPHKMQVTANLLREMGQGQGDLVRIQKMRILAQNRLRNKLKLYLQSLAIGSEGDLCLNMGRSELAEYLCVDHSALSRELSRMQKEGILTVQGQHVHMLDKGFLE